MYMIRSMKGFVLKVIVFLLVVSFLVGMGWLTYQAGVQREYAEQIDGRKKVLSGRGDARDLLAVLRNAQKEQHKVEISELEINQYLAEKVTASQSGVTGKYATFKGVWVDLRKDEIEIFIEREFKLPSSDENAEAEEGQKEDSSEKTVDSSAVKLYMHTTSLVVLVKSEKKSDGGVTKEFGVQHGYCGKTKLPGMFALAVKPAFDNLAIILEDEIAEGLEKMQMVNVYDGKMVFNPVREVITKPLPK